MPKMTGGQALAKSLYREGVRVIFGLPGVQLYHLLDALYDEPGIRFITTRHEQATTYMADGYARAGGGIGTALVVPGPGLLNSAAALLTAYGMNAPVLGLIGEIPHRDIGRGLGHLHEIRDQAGIIERLVDHYAHLSGPSEAPGKVAAAFRAMASRRPGPAVLSGLSGPIAWAVAAVIVAGAVFVGLRYWRGVKEAEGGGMSAL